VVLALLAGLAACGRSGLDLAAAPSPPADASRTTDGRIDQAAELGPDAEADQADDAPAEAPLDLAAERAPDLPLERGVEAPDAAAEAGARVDAAPRPDAGPACQPTPETCNGRDDDCDGNVDQELPPIPCPDGGERYCVSGRYSECPRRCEVCVPGSHRECFTSFCTFWGTQACASDGRSFGACREGHPPDACADVAAQSKKSPELERCCLDTGHCCVDEFDLDHDGDRAEMLGRCEAVMCTP
jgi:hypothetical protein